MLFTGLDLGQTQDPTAMALADVEGPITERVCRIRGLKRWPLRTKYTAIAEDVDQMMSSGPLRGSILIVDHTGVGRGVVDLFRKTPSLSGLHAVTITGGDKTSREDKDWRVPKKDLVGIVQVLLESGRLWIAPDCEDAQTLVSELQTFQMKVTDAGNETYGAWRTGKHDDLVLAVALACWGAVQDAFHSLFEGWTLEQISEVIAGRGVKGWGY